MSIETIKNKIEELRTELDSVAKDDPETRDKLLKLISELEEKLEQPDEHHSLIDTMNEAISNFETEHPRATAILNDIMVTLSNMGI